MNIGQKIRAIRKSKGIRAIDLSVVANISQGYLSKIENNKTPNIGLDILLAIAKGLGVSIISFFDKENDHPSKVYGVYSGCKFEGGGVDGVYRKEENARLVALAKVKKENKSTLKYAEDDDDKLNLFKEVKKNQWESITDIVKVVEYKLN